MKHNSNLASLVALCFVLTSSALAQNWKETINAGVGLYASGPVTMDSSGYLYGTNSAGGNGTYCYYGCGQVYQFLPNGHKPTHFLYSFSGGTDGNEPYGKVLVDAKGNVYGVTLFGGDFSGPCYSGCGVVYELSPTSTGWTESVLYAFQGGTDGALPVSIVPDGKGNLFGLTEDGGGNSCHSGTQCGTVFELSPNSTGGWTETVLYTFTGQTDGGNPIGSLLLDQQGNLYGATVYGGNAACTSGCGVIFKLSPSSSSWTYSTVYSFDGTHGANPQGSLVMDSSGNLFGNAYDGARSTSSHCPYGCGSTFELSPSSTGWKISLLRSFSDGFDGGNPNGGLMLDAKGNLYGATYQGGSQAYGCLNGYQQGCGVVFKFSPASGSKWIFDRLYTFQGYDGFGPFGDLVMDVSGNLYGTTIQGESYGNLFEIVPPTH